MTRGVTAFQPARLRQLLAARRFTQVQLATLVGVSEATVSKWRVGPQAPEPATLERLASVGNVSAEWFTRPVLPAVTQGLFRSNASAHAAARAMLQARVELLQELANALGEFVEFPSLRLPVRDFTNPEEITDHDIEEAAAECRALWRLGKSPIADVILAVESAGVLVAREVTGIAQIEGLSSWSDLLTRPLVLLSADKANAYRSRFDLSHELGHLVLHRHVERTTERDRHKMLERQAHRFAGAFLLPAETFSREIRTPLSLDDLVLCKRRWGVSVGAMLMRLRALEIIDADEYQTLQKRISYRWGRKAEPSDEDRVPEAPRVLRRTIELLVERGIMPARSIPSLVGLSAFDLEQLASLRPGYFDTSADVIQLARLRTATSSNAQSTAQDSQVVPFRR
jgi:Zn-dependent peptidase ImmA (M78 family)